MLKNSKSCFISVTLKSWSGRKLLDPTTYRTIIFSAVLCGCKTWSRTLRKAEVKDVEQQVLRKTCRPTREEVSVGMLKLRNKKLYSSLNINVMATVIMRMRWAGHVAYLGLTTYTKYFRG